MGTQGPRARIIRIREGRIHGWGDWCSEDQGSGSSEDSDSEESGMGPTIWARQIRRVRARRIRIRGILISGIRGARIRIRRARIQAI